MSDSYGDFSLLYDFLTLEADLAETYLRTCDLERGDSPERSAKALRNAVASLATMRRLLTPRYLNPAQVAEIQSRCEALGTRIKEREAGGSAGDSGTGDAGMTTPD